MNLMNPSLALGSTFVLAVPDAPVVDPRETPLVTGQAPRVIGNAGKP